MIKTCAKLILGVLIFCLSPILSADPLLSADFEVSPAAQGWTASGPGAVWTSAEHASGVSCLLAQTGVWSSPVLSVQPLQWYRLSFKTKAPGVLNPAATGSAGYALWSADFYDSSGNLLPSDQYSSVFQLDGWVTNEFRVRAKAIAGPNGSLLPSRMQISFRPVGGLPLYIDDVSVATTTPEEVTQWADTVYASGPQLSYIPKNNVTNRLPLTLQKLRSGQNLRILFLGDSVQCDMGNSPIDTFLQREYPGSHVQVITSTGHGTGMQTLKNSVQYFVLDYVPDLVILGGISNTDDMSSFQSIVDQVRASDRVTAHATEFLAVTKNWSPNVTSYFLSPSLQELDQNPASDMFIPLDYRGHLLQWANSQGIEYLDLTGIDSEFIYGPASQAGVGPPDNSGVPYNHWMRDHTHSNDYGKQIMGRILEAYFAPVTSPIPVHLTAQPGNGRITLSWRSGASGWNIYRCLGTAGAYTLLASASVTGLVDTSVSNGTSYSYVVKSQVPEGESSASNAVSAIPLSPPLTPSGLNGGSHNGYAKLAWTASQGALGYYLYRGLTSSGPFNALVSTNTTAYTDLRLTNGTTYYYTFTALGAGGESAVAPVVSVTPLSPPLAPQSLTATPGNGLVSLTWTAPASAPGVSNPAGYQILRSLTQGGPYIALNVKPPGTSYVDKGRQNGVLYSYIVTAMSAQGTSPRSSEASAIPQAKSP